MDQVCSFLYCCEASGSPLTKRCRCVPLWTPTAPSFQSFLSNYAMRIRHWLCSS